MRSTVMAFWLVWVLLGTSAYGSPILNGDFSTPGVSPDRFADWTTEVSLFDRPLDGGGFALFGNTGTTGSSQLAQSFGLPSGALSLSFEFQIGTMGVLLQNSVRDSLQATLFDGGGTLFPSDPMFPLSFPAFYSIDNDGVFESFDPLFVTSLDIGGGFKRVTLNVSSLSPQTLVIDFLLNGLPDGLSTTVGLDNVILTQAAIPEPASLVLWAAFGSLMSCLRPRLRSRPDVLAT